MHKLLYSISLFLISVFLSSCSENIKEQPVTSVSNNPQFDYFDDTKGKPKSEVAIIINPTKKNINGLRVYKIGRKKVPSNGLVYQGKDLVVSPGIKFLHIQHSEKQFRFMTILEKGKTYILNFTTKDGDSKYYVRDKITGENRTLSHIKN